MGGYDLTVLNDKEFEILIADLMSEELKVRVERFKPGKDKGVDGRFFATPAIEVILQCKHWPKSSLTTLLTNLRSEELKKLNVLAPKRYLFFCSLELSRANKAKIALTLAPHIKLESDVYGREDIHDLLNRHPAVERRHPKLWLSSAGVLVNLINNAILARSDDALVDIKRSLSRYVDTDEAVIAREKLSSSKVLIIKGLPGVGKTTLAQQLVTECLAEGYKLVVIERDISEAEGVFDSSTQQIFYFDDFLGRNFLEAMDYNKDSHIVNFMKRIVGNRKKRFVLTTRTHILESGKRVSDIFQIEKIERKEFELSVGKFSRFEKAKILYSHIWCSGLPDWAVAELYRDKNYLRVVDHVNYNPRIISFITDADRVSEIAPANFWKYVLDTLDFPEGIWRHVFEHQIGPDSRDLAILVAYNGQSIAQSDLEDAFIRLHQGAGFSELELRHRFNAGVKLAVGSVLNRTLDASGAATCTLFNPSVADYLLKDSETIAAIVPIARALRTTHSLDYLESLHQSAHIDEMTFHKALRLVVEDLNAERKFADRYSVCLGATLIRLKVSHLGRDFLINVGNSISPNALVLADRSYLAIFCTEINAGLLQNSAQKFDQILDELPKFDPNSFVMNKLLESADYLDSIDGKNRRDAMRSVILEMWVDNAEMLVKDDNVLSEFLDEDDFSGAIAAAEEFFEREFDLRRIV